MTMNNAGNVAVPSVPMHVVRSALSLALLAVATAAASPVRFAADASLFGLSYGGMISSAGMMPGHSEDVTGHLMRLGVGAETRRGLGVTVGVTLIQMKIEEFSFLPLTAQLHWNFDPDQRWRHGTAYLFATYHYNSTWGDFGDGDPMAPFMEYGIGAAYTFYVVTPKAELRLRPGVSFGSRISALFGFDLGGTYVFGRREGHV